MHIPARMFPTIFVLGGLVLLAGGALRASAARSVTGTVIELPGQDRNEIEKYLGRGVVGRAVEAHPIDDPAAFLGLGEQPIRLRARVVYGEGKGSIREARIRRDPRADGHPAWRLEGGKDVWYGAIDAQGNLVQHSTQDGKQGVISRYTPAEPMIYRNMTPGTSQQMRIDVKVFDLSRPDKQSHSGYLDLTYSYIGAYEVKVPAGTYEAALFKWQYDGKVGPASVKDDQYWFYAEGVGPVARIDKKDVSAMLIYRDTSKIATVLVSRE